MDTIREWWGAIMAATGLGIWLVRLEGSSKTALRECLTSAPMEQFSVIA